MLAEVLKDVHDESWTEGHFGLTKILEKLREKYFMRSAEISGKIGQIMSWILGKKEESFTLLTNFLNSHADGVRITWLSAYRRHLTDSPSILSPHSHSRQRSEMLR
ncbi:hypothetical protein EVAR_23481_1 [Eumeta japonica]|uniref:Integrase zinc-binding domain-containing protein n=1 Tax=Eumeta variegata TaxID=151549 RepID=A0A4C1UKN6_EUMVA|nr:hypothetical protein EVAR_23481_1 [Eumeta japonica]